MHGLDLGQARLVRRAQHSLDQRLNGIRQAAGQRANVGGITAAAPTDETNVFALGDLAELEELAPRDLNRFQVVGKSRVASE
jgi:hypothetical protein